MPGGRRLLALLLLTLLSLTPALAQGLSYTVQVVAVSDQQSALAVQRTLLDRSFPAYVVRAATAQGDIYRVRVGAFANRLAALVFSEAMEEVAGSSPLPALAEGIPAGVMPLQPRALLQVDADEALLLEWREDGAALRVQEESQLPATYHVVTPEGSTSIVAWRVVPLEEGGLLLANLPLWPAQWQELTVEEREEYRIETLESLSQVLAVERERLEELQFRPVFGPPFLVVLREFASLPTGDGTIVGVAAAGGGEPSGFGPETVAIGSAELPPLAEPLYTVQADSDGLDELAGEGWQVSADDSFFRLSTEQAPTPWRAGIGTPLWSDSRLLLTRTDSGLLLYDFVAR